MSKIWYLRKKYLNINPGKFEHRVQRANYYAHRDREEWIINGEFELWSITAKHASISRKK